MSCAAAVAAAVLVFGEPIVPVVKMPDFAASDGAVCLDGSPGAFLFLRPNATGAEENFLLFFQGGGWCYDEEDCYGRSTWSLGSSKTWSEEAFNGGVSSSDCNQNPTFCNYTKVKFLYCDGNSFSGDRDDPITVQGKLVYFRGKRIREAILKTLVRDYGLGKAKNVLLSGCSAGGLATYLHADEVGDFLRANVPGLQKYRAAPVSGFFLDHPNLDNAYVYTEQMRYVFQMQNATMNKACLSENPASKWKCNMAQYVYPHVQTPLFVLNSALDMWQTWCILASKLTSGFPNQTDTSHGHCNSFEQWTGCTTVPETNCTAEQIPVLNQYIVDYMSVVQGSPKFNATGNGGFHHSCHMHCEGASWWFCYISINGVRMNEAVAKWWESDGKDPASEHTYYPCEYKPWSGMRNRLCNPTCPEPHLKPVEHFFAQKPGKF